ncbi:MAG: purine-nucleoside phosphorylase [Clostridia bacterium]
MNFAPTPHNSAKKGDFAKTVLMPGDPLRSTYIAENFLTKATLVNNVRDIRGYTGFYKGKPISVMASGMGVPSMAIYSYELFNFYDVENIIRVGSCGGIAKDVNVNDIVISQATSTNSNYPTLFNVPGTLAPTADFHLIELAKQVAQTMDFNLHIGPTMCCDEFYHNDEDVVAFEKMGMLALEMETVALYLNALKAKKKAIGIFTVVNGTAVHDDIVLSPLDREKNLNHMIELALETAILI